MHPSAPRIILGIPLKSCKCIHMSLQHCCAWSSQEACNESRKDSENPGVNSWRRSYSHLVLGRLSDLTNGGACTQEVGAAALFWTLSGAETGQQHNLPKLSLYLPPSRHPPTPPAGAHRAVLQDGKSRQPALSSTLTKHVLQGAGGSASIFRTYK